MTDNLPRFMDWGIRGGACAVLTFLAVLLLRDSGKGWAARLGALSAIGGAAFALSSAAGAQDLMGVWRSPLRVLATGETAILWLCALQLFDDSFRLKAWHVFVWGAVLLIAVVNVSLPRDSLLLPWIETVVTFQAPCFAILTVVQTLLTWRGDLVERRRSARTVVIGGAAVYALSYTLMDAVADRVQSVRHSFSLAEGLGLLAVAVLAAGAVLRVSSNAMAPAQTSPAKSLAANLGPADRTALAQLEKLMTVERLYRQESLSIGGLAGQLGLPEYKLRRLINQALGHRNFAGFVNGYRINDAMIGLADPQQAQVPVLTIALDAGFASLGPFNRAFKAETGLTPTEFRAQALNAVSEDPALSASRISNSA